MRAGGDQFIWKAELVNKDMEYKWDLAPPLGIYNRHPHYIEFISLPQIPTQFSRKGLKGSFSVNMISQAQRAHQCDIQYRVLGYRKK